MSAAVRRPIVGLFQVGSLLMVLLAVALLAAVITMHFAIHGAEVQVPSLKGMTVADARSQTAGLGLNLDVDNRYYSSQVAAGHILTQTPPPGTVVRREWHVRVSESLGPQKVSVPNTVGSDERVAALNLQRAGLAIGTIARIPYGDAAEGTVLAQDPPPNAQGIAGPSVSVLVAAPGNTTPGGYVMPDLTGMTVVSAQAALQQAGLKLTPPTYADVQVPAVGNGSAPPRLPIAPGSVMAQQPVAGVRVDAGTSVKLTVAK